MGLYLHEVEGRLSWVELYRETIPYSRRDLCLGGGAQMGGVHNLHDLDSLRLCPQNDASEVVPATRKCY